MTRSSVHNRLIVQTGTVSSVAEIETRLGTSCPGYLTVSILRTLCKTFRRLGYEAQLGNTVGKVAKILDSKDVSTVFWAAAHSRFACKFIHEPGVTDAISE